MELYKVSRCIKKRITTHYVQTSGGEEHYKYGEVRCGCSFPSGGGPIFMTIIGQCFDDLDGLLGFSQLAEVQSDDISPERFFNRLIIK